MDKRMYVSDVDDVYSNGSQYEYYRNYFPFKKMTCTYI